MPSSKPPSGREVAQRSCDGRRMRKVPFRKLPQSEIKDFCQPPPGGGLITTPEDSNPHGCPWG